MNSDLQQRLDTSMSPFDGWCIRNACDLSLSQLRELLTVTVSLLSPYAEIYSFPDWHEHDGFIVDSNLTSWDAVGADIKTNRTLFESRHDDFGVRVAIYPADFTWLLRYNIDDGNEADYNTATCDFDLSAAKDKNQSGMFDCLLELFPSFMLKCETLQWFESSYGG